MNLSMTVKKHDDGTYSAEVPSIKGCESWAHNEDEVIDKTLDLVAFYLKLEHSHFALDRTSKVYDTTVYKIIFNKSR